jgi:hypothetical protein
MEQVDYPVEFLRLPFFEEIAPARRVLVAGMGGGFDVYCGLPLFFGLRSAGKETFLANLSFAPLGPGAGRRLAPAVVEVTGESQGDERYFPELHLARWLRDRGEKTPVYAFPQTGVAPLVEAYRTLAAELEPDAVVLIDGGTDSLMRGDEAGLGTPEEDIASLAAVALLDGPARFLVSVGFGVDHFHGVCHTHFLEAVADLTRAGAFLGAWSLTAEMPEVQLYAEAAFAAMNAMPTFPSIVSSSILSAVAGQFDDYHVSHRTRGSKLFINPLMTLYWAFRLEAVADRLLYPEALYATQTMAEVSEVIHGFRSAAQAKAWRDLPL